MELSQDLAQIDTQAKARLFLMFAWTSGLLQVFFFLLADSIGSNQ